MFAKEAGDKVGARGEKSRKTLKSREEIATTGVEAIKGGKEPDKHI